MNALKRFFAAAAIAVTGLAMDAEAQMVEITYPNGETRQADCSLLHIEAKDLESKQLLGEFVEYDENKGELVVKQKKGGEWQQVSLPMGPDDYALQVFLTRETTQELDINHTKVGLSKYLLSEDPKERAQQLSNNLYLFLVHVARLHGDCVTVTANLEEKLGVQDVSEIYETSYGQSWREMKGCTVLDFRNDCKEALGLADKKNDTPEPAQK